MISEQKELWYQLNSIITF